MNASFDGARKNLARSYNKLIRAMPEPDEEQCDVLTELHNDIVILLCMYTDDMDNCHDLIDTVRLAEVPEGEA